MPSLPYCAPTPLSKPSPCEHPTSPALLSHHGQFQHTLVLTPHQAAPPALSYFLASVTPNQITSTHVHFLHHIWVPAAPQEGSSSMWMSHRPSHPSLSQHVFFPSWQRWPPCTMFCFTIDLFRKERGGRAPCSYPWTVFFFLALPSHLFSCFWIVKINFP